MNLLATVAPAVNPDSLWEQFRIYFTDFDQIFPGFPDQANTARSGFYMIAAAIIIYQIISKLRSSSNTEASVQALLSGLIASIMVCLCIPIYNIAQTTISEYSRELGKDGSPLEIEMKVGKILTVVTNGGPVSASETNDVNENHSIFYYIFHPGAAISNSTDNIVGAFYSITVQAIIFILTASFKFFQLCTWVVILLQKFILIFNSIFLPMMVSFVGVSALSSIGVRYILGMLGVMAWPIGWSLVNVGTAGFLDTIDITLAQAEWHDIGSFIFSAAIILLLPMWVAGGYIFAPLAIQKMITSGAGAAQGIVGGAASTTAQLAGAAVLGGAAAAAGGASAAVPGAGSSAALGGASATSSTGLSSMTGGGASNGPDLSGNTPLSGGAVASSAGPNLNGQVQGASPSQSSASGSAQSSGGSGGYSGAAMAMHTAANQVAKAGDALAQSEGHSGGINLADGVGSNSSSVTSGESGAGSGPQNSVSNASPAPIDLSAAAKSRASQMATPALDNPSAQYPGLSPSSAKAWASQHPQAVVPA